MIKHLGLYCAVSLLLVGCVGTDTQNTPDITQSATPNQSSNVSVSQADLWSRIGGLPPQDIAVDSCGLFLWANMPKRTLVFFADTIVAEGVIMLDGQPYSLPRVSAAGDVVLGHFSNQLYEQGGLKVTVSYTAQFKEGLKGGAIIREGTWRVEDKEGWEVILPVAGLIGCN